MGMLEVRSSDVSAPPVNPAARVPVRSRFFLVLTVVLLGIVFAGFAPTFYLDPLFDTPTRVTSIAYPDASPLPPFLVLHAVLLTAWFAGLVVQSTLVGRGRLDVHRVLGTVGIVIAVGVVVSGAVATLGIIPRATGEHVLVTSNSLNLLVFVALVSVAIHKRSRPQVHKRLMLIATIAIIGPAVGPDRMLGRFLGSLVSDVITIPVPLLFWVLLIGALVVYDLWVLGRVHPATAWGGAAKATAAAATVVLVNSGGAASYVEWLESLGLTALAAGQ